MKLSKWHRQVLELPVFSSREELERKLSTSRRVKVADIAEITASEKEGYSKKIYYVLGRNQGSQAFPFPESPIDIYVTEKIFVKRDLRVKGKYAEIEKINPGRIRTLGTSETFGYLSLAPK